MRMEAVGGVVVVVWESVEMGVEMGEGGKKKERITLRKILDAAQEGNNVRGLLLADVGGVNPTTTL